MESKPTEEIIHDLVVRREYLSSTIPILHSRQKEDQPDDIWDMENELESINWLLKLFSDMGQKIPDAA